MERELLKESADYKLIVLRFLKYWWMFVVAALLGALIGGGLYFLEHVVYGPGREYTVASRFYVTYDTDNMDKTAATFNAYAWQEFLTSDVVLNKTFEAVTLQDATTLTKEMFADMIAVEMKSDARLVTAVITGNDSDLIQTMARALESAVVAFGNTMGEIKSIEIIHSGMPELIVVTMQTGKAIVTGAVVAVLLGIFALFLYHILDDAIYVPATFEKRYGYFMLGVTYKEGTAEDVQTAKAKKELEIQTGLLSEGYVNIAKIIPGQELTALKEYDAAILLIPYGKACAKQIEKTISQVKMRKLPILGAVLEEADAAFIRRYYEAFFQKKRSSKHKMKNKHKD